MKINNHIEVSHKYTFDDDFTYEQLMIIKKKEPWLLKQLAMNYFWIFCQLIMPEMYNSDHLYLREICHFIQGSWQDPAAKFVTLSIPPQHGKSLTLNLFSLYLLILDKKIRIFNLSYNEDYAIEASKNLLDRIKAVKEDENQFIANDFANIKIKKGEGSKNNWTIEGGRSTWFSSSYNAGSVTGKSAQLVILDDLIKSYDVSINKREKKKINTFISATLLSRKSGQMKIFVPQTRWAKDDPIGFLLMTYGNRVRTLKMKAYDPISETMLCSSILDLESYMDIVKANKINGTEDVIEANYNQEPVDIKGCLITHYNKWDKDTFPAEIDIKKSFCVCDTSDTGGDYFAALCGVITRDNKIFIKDLIYMSDGVEKTIPATAEMIKNNKIKYGIIESNNGGRVIALDIKKELKQNKWDVPIKWFHQSNNKETRIKTNAAKIMNNIFWPPEFDQEGKWERFYEDFTNFQKEFSNNEHDDCLDVATMCIEFAEGRLKEK